MSKYSFDIKCVKAYEDRYLFRNVANVWILEMTLLKEHPGFKLAQTNEIEQHAKNVKM